MGDQIVIASTEFDHKEAEVRTIVEVRNGGQDIVLDKALDHRHYGQIETYDNGKSGGDFREWDIDMRAEVGLLTRNVTITGDENASEDHFGGHSMVMMGGSMQISGAEFTKMGQEGILGRYGAHWHLSGDATGQFIENSSFHEIYNKGITLHGVQNAVVEDNVVFGTIGHSYFMEDAAEFGNMIKDNLGLGTTRPDSMEEALTEGDFEHVSTFWIENPNNTITGNHAAGSDNAGFWFAPSEAHGLSESTGVFDDINARRDRYWNSLAIRHTRTNSIWELKGPWKTVPTKNRSSIRHSITQDRTLSLKTSQLSKVPTVQSGRGLWGDNSTISSQQIIRGPLSFLTLRQCTTV